MAKEADVEIDLLAVDWDQPHWLSKPAKPAKPAAGGSPQGPEPQPPQEAEPLPDWIPGE